MKLRIGSGLPNIQKKDLAMFKIIVPKIEWQIKISTFLSSLEKKNAEIEEMNTECHAENKKAISIATDVHINIWARKILLLHG